MDPQPRGDEFGQGATNDEPLDREASRALVEAFGRPFAQGDVLFREGDAATCAFVLEEGRVRLLKRVRSVERSVSVLHPGEMFGEDGLLAGALRRATAVAISDGLVLAVDRPALRRILERFSPLAERLVAQLVARVRDAEDQVDILMLRDAESKVVSALLKMAGSRPGPVELVVSPVDLSNRVVLDVDTVKRTVQRLRDQQYVRIAGDRVAILEVDALRRLYALLGAKEELRGER